MKMTSCRIVSIFYGLAWKAWPKMVRIVRYGAHGVCGVSCAWRMYSAWHITATIQYAIVNGKINYTVAFFVR